MFYFDKGRIVLFLNLEATVTWQLLRWSTETIYTPDLKSSLISLMII